MPNHTANNLTVSGPNEDVRRFVEAAKSKTDPTYFFDFNNIVPMPDELKGTVSPTRIMEQSEIDAVWAKWNLQKENGTLSEWERDKPWGLGISKEKHDELISKYGCDNWYDWKTGNWGTKWGAYDTKEWVFGEINSDTTASIYYETAWSPATQFLLKASCEYPTLTFHQEFADEGGGFIGTETIKNGEIVDSKEFEWDSEAGKEKLISLGRYNESDDEDADEDTEAESTEQV